MKIAVLNSFNYIGEKQSDDVTTWTFAKKKHSDSEGDEMLGTILVHLCFAHTEHRRFFIIHPQRQPQAMTYNRVAIAACLQLCA